MICSRCQTPVPDESTFCLSCGTRLVREEHLPTNGGGGPPAPAGTAAPDAPALPSAPEAVPAASPTSQQPYALSFHPIADERLRYRVARWVCGRAPAHPLTEVQDGLLHGDFLTFLALTAPEAEVVLAEVRGLGVVPPLVSLVPAGGLEAFVPPVAARRRAQPAPRGRQNWMIALLVAVGLLIVGLVLMRLFGGRGF